MTTERQVRTNVRNFLLAATLPELLKEKQISEEQKDTLRTKFVQELIDEYDEMELTPPKGI
jgi:hypothetical protein